MLTLIGFGIIIAFAIVGVSIIIGCISAVCAVISDIIDCFFPSTESIRAQTAPSYEEPPVPERKSKRRKSQQKHPVNEYVFVDDRDDELNNHSSIKEYVLPDGSKVALDTEQVPVTETSVVGQAMRDRTPAERFGGGMAEIIRKRREAEVF